MTNKQRAFLCAIVWTVTTTIAITLAITNFITGSIFIASLWSLAACSDTLVTILKYMDWNKLRKDDKKSL